MNRSAWLGLLAAGTLLAAPAAAQTRRGFWFETGGGFGAIRVSCSGCADLTRASGSSGYLRLGGRLSHRVLIGFEAFSYTKQAFGFAEDDPKALAEVASAQAILLWYPGGRKVFLKGGLGAANGQFILDAGTPEEANIEGTGVGLSFGAGFDVPVFRWLALTGNAGAFVTAVGDLVLPTRRVDDVISTLYQLNVGITIR